MSWFTYLMRNITGKAPLPKPDPNPGKPKNLIVTDSGISDAEALLRRGEQTGKPIVETKLGRDIATLTRYGEEKAREKRQPTRTDPIIVDPKDFMSALKK